MNREHAARWTPSDRWSDFDDEAPTTPRRFVLPSTASAPPPLSGVRLASANRAVPVIDEETRLFARTRVSQKVSAQPAGLAFTRAVEEPSLPVDRRLPATAAEPYGEIEPDDDALEACPVRLAQRPRKAKRWGLRIGVALLLVAGEIIVAARSGSLSLPRDLGEAKAILRAAAADVAR